MSQNLRPADLMRLMGWPWWCALLALGAADTSLLLPHLAGGVPKSAQPLATWLPLLGSGLAALLALLAGPRALARCLAMANGPDTLPVPADTEEVLAALRTLLREERGQLHEAASSVRNALAVGVQLAGVAQETERRLREAAEQRQVLPSPSAGPALETAEEGRVLLAMLRQTVSETEAGLSAATSRLAAASKSLEQPPPSSTAEEGMKRLEQALLRFEHPLAGPVGDMTPHLHAVQEATQSLAGVIAQAGRTETALQAAEATLVQLPGTLERLQLIGRTLIQSAGAVEVPALQLAALAERCETALCGNAQTQGGLHRLETVLEQLERVLREAGGDTVLATLHEQTGILTHLAGTLAQLAAADQQGVSAELTGLRDRVQALADRLAEVERTPERLTAQIAATLDRLRPGRVSTMPAQPAAS